MNTLNLNNTESINADSIFLVVDTELKDIYDIFATIDDLSNVSGMSLYIKPFPKRRFFYKPLDTKVKEPKNQNRIALYYPPSLATNIHTHTYKKKENGNM